MKCLPKFYRKLPDSKRQRRARLRDLTIARLRVVKVNGILLTWGR